MPYPISDKNKLRWSSLFYNQKSNKQTYNLIYIYHTWFWKPHSVITSQRKQTLGAVVLQRDLGETNKHSKIRYHHSKNHTGLSLHRGNKLWEHKETWERQANIQYNLYRTIPSLSENHTRLIPSQKKQTLGAVVSQRDLGETNKHSKILYHHSKKPHRLITSQRKQTLGAVVSQRDLGETSKHRVQSSIVFPRNHTGSSLSHITRETNSESSCRLGETSTPAPL